MTTSAYPTKATGPRTAPLDTGPPTAVTGRTDSGRNAGPRKKSVPLPPLPSPRHPRRSTGSRSSSSAPGAEDSSVSIVVRSPSWRAARSWLSAAGVVALLAAALAGPAVVRAQDGHHDGPTRLVDLSVRVQTADPGSATVFAATWIGHAGSGPDAIRVTVDSTAFNLAPASGRSAGAGRRYARSVVLDPGRHRVRFTVTGRGHFRTVVDWGIVVVPRTARTGATTGSGASNPVSGGGGSGPGGSSGGSGSGPGGSSGGSGSGRGATGGMAGGTDPGTGPSASGSVGSGSSHDDPPVAGGGTAPDGGTAAVDGVATGAADGTPGPATAGRSEDSAGPRSLGDGRSTCRLGRPGRRGGPRRGRNGWRSIGSGSDLERGGRGRRRQWCGGHDRWQRWPDRRGRAERASPARAGRGPRGPDVHRGSRSDDHDGRRRGLGCVHDVRQEAP